jgi:bla regulator protein BlaR1
MTNALWIRDVGAFSLQVAAVVAAGAAVASVCRLRQPRAMHLFWRLLLLACLALPFCQPWQTASTMAGTQRPLLRAVPAATLPSTFIAPASTAPSTSLIDVLSIVLLAGAALRVVWLLMGALALQRLRRRATALQPMPEGIRESQLRVGARGDVLVTDRATGPMTFGLFRPVILLPTEVLEMPPAIQEAITCHELIHVRRRDWIAEIFEEAVRTILWFHPAVWWLIGRIRLSREQVVDEAVIAITHSKERYVDALLLIALRKSPLTLVPAPTFFRRSLLKTRVAHIMQETTMTTHRLIASLTASAVIALLAGVFAVRSFPLQAQAAASVKTGDPVQIVKGGDHLMHGGLPEYPGRAIKQQVEGEVVLDVAVDDRGEVADARVLTGPDELRRAALESVLQWHYAPAAVSNRSVQVVLEFHLPVLELASKEDEGLSGRTFRMRGLAVTRETESELSAHQKAERRMAEMEEALKSPKTLLAEKEELLKELEKVELWKKLDEAKEEFERDRLAQEGTKPDAGTLQLTRVRTERVPDGIAGEILANAGLAVGDVVSEESLKRVRSIATRTDEHIEVEFGRDEHGGVILTFITR